MTDEAMQPEAGLYEGYLDQELTDAGKEGLGRDTVEHPDTVNPEDGGVAHAILAVWPYQPWEQPVASVRINGWPNPARYRLELARKGRDEDGQYWWRAEVETRGGDAPDMVTLLVLRQRGPARFSLRMRQAPPGQLDAPWLLTEGTLQPSPDFPED